MKPKLKYTLLGVILAFIPPAILLLSSTFFLKDAGFIGELFQSTKQWWMVLALIGVISGYIYGCITKKFVRSVIIFIYGIYYVYFIYYLALLIIGRVFVGPLFG